MVAGFRRIAECAEQGQQCRVERVAMPCRALAAMMAPVSASASPSRSAHPGQPAEFLYEFVNHLRQKGGRNALRGAHWLNQLIGGFLGMAEADLDVVIRQLAKTQHKSLMDAAKKRRDFHMAQAAKAKDKGVRDRAKQAAKDTMLHATAAAKRVQNSADNAADSYKRAMKKAAEEAAAAAAAKPVKEKPAKKEKPVKKAARKKNS
jgi:hypothetical protein